MIIKKLLICQWLCRSFCVLYLLCSVHLMGSFHMHSGLFSFICRVSPHPGLVMHFVLKRHMLLCLEVLVLNPSYLSSVDTLHTGGGNLSVSRTFVDAHVDSLSVVHTAHTHTHTHADRKICSIAYSNFKVRLLTETVRTASGLFVHQMSAYQVSSDIGEEQPSCGSIHSVSTANHKHSQIAGRCRHAQEFSHLKSWPHYARHTNTHTHTEREREVHL